MEIFRKLYREGAMDDRKIRLDIPDGRVRLPVDIVSGGSYAVNELIYRVIVFVMLVARPVMQALTEICDLFFSSQLGTIVDVCCTLRY